MWVVHTHLPLVGWWTSYSSPSYYLPRSRTDGRPGPCATHTTPLIPQAWWFPLPLTPFPPPLPTQPHSCHGLGCTHTTPRRYPPLAWCHWWLDVVLVCRTSVTGGGFDYPRYLALPHCPTDSGQRCPDPGRPGRRRRTTPGLHTDITPRAVPHGELPADTACPHAPTARARTPRTLNLDNPPGARPPPRTTPPRRTTTGDWCPQVVARWRRATRTPPCPFPNRTWADRWRSDAAAPHAHHALTFADVPRLPTPPLDRRCYCIPHLARLPTPAVDHPRLDGHPPPPRCVVPLPAADKTRDYPTPDGW